MADRRQIERRARLAIARVLRVHPSQLTDNAEFAADLGADSLHSVEITQALEEEFGLEISDDQADFCRTVGTAIDLIEARLEDHHD